MRYGSGDGVAIGIDLDKLPVLLVVLAFSWGLLSVLLDAALCLPVLGGYRL